LIPTPDTWGELLVLPENRSAVRAAERLCVALLKQEKRIRSARPVVWHGPTGCGKSALVRSLVRAVVGGESARTVQVVSAGELPREPDELTELKACDLLAVEDVQHLKSADSEPLLALLDHRIVHGRPTVVTSPHGPANLAELPHRLTNRLAGGLVVRLDTPGLASRKRFAEWRASAFKLRLAPEALDWLANTADGLRHLIGLIDTLRRVGSPGKGELSAREVRELLADPLPPTPLLDRITRTVAQAFRVKPKELLGASRLRTVLVPRQVAMYLGREVAKLPLTVIGEHFGGRDHTTVLNAVRKIAAVVKADEELAGRVRELQRELE
jgi:chromosomal replication initiator protein